jgi:hypothetical protein
MQGGRLRGCIVGCAALLTLTGCLFAPSHDVTAPGKPSGLTVGLVGEPLAFSIAGAACTRSDPVVYQWDWGDGQTSDWVNEDVAAHTWGSPGTYMARARARCQDDASVVSGWSEALNVLVMPLPVPTL